MCSRPRSKLPFYYLPTLGLAHVTLDLRPSDIFRLTINGVGLGTRLARGHPSTPSTHSSTLLLTLAGTDERAIVSVLAYRSNGQRQEVKSKFKALYGKVNLCVVAVKN